MLTTSLYTFLFKIWENVLFEVGSEKVNCLQAGVRVLISMFFLEVPFGSSHLRASVHSSGALSRHQMVRRVLSEKVLFHILRRIEGLGWHPLISESFAFYPVSAEAWMTKPIACQP